MSLPPIEIVLFVQYRLSHPRSDGIPDVPMHNKIVLFTPSFNGVPAEFIEGFDCKELLIEAYQATYSFRKQTLVPVMRQNMDKLKITGSIVDTPQIRSKLSITPAPAGFKVNEESEAFSCDFRDIDATHGQTIDNYNGEKFGTVTGVNFYNRSVKTVPYHRNVCSARSRLSPTPPPEPIAERILEEILAE